ncbi:ParB N-terminal domain-containing protein [Streptomyces sp. NBC_00654]|uniref:ParB/RepB/Spo0J family partition protein n=1 Tax=Streptomyces sp. NBC_00654 TaxID=2975799 RepID=UPI0022543669|nr:ParB N-terminal domain-containing protein [Streptomyces sp. NBC_00654]MCX4970979.1 ParB N-terminal domain-containing protein [Streptomyces sp. NBC_00654]MCX4971224.1 ParB N-terminal domain-containing protein [Streptomyces sp. NBC_00654]
MEKLVPTRFNPRRNFGTDKELKEFGLKLKKRQLQPAVVVSRAGYLKLWPVEEEHVGAAPYVIANGERRYRGSRLAGLSTLNVVHNEDVAKTRADFLDAVLSENNDREDLDPIERAIGIEIMVAELGGADRVADHYAKTKGWVSQQRKLLKLTPELQILVSSGEMPVRVARDIAGLPAAEQAQAWSDEENRRLAAQSMPRAPRGRRASQPVSSKPVPSTPVTAPELVEPKKRFTAVNQHPDADTEESHDRTPRLAAGQDRSVPEPRSTFSDDGPSGPLLPTLEPAALAELVIDQLAPADRKKLTTLLITYNSSQIARSPENQAPKAESGSTARETTV